MFVIATMVSAVIVLFMLTICYPFLTNIWYSLLSYDLTRPDVRPFVGLANYVDILTDPDFWQPSVALPTTWFPPWGSVSSWGY